jgi:hypothetical protein
MSVTDVEQCHPQLPVTEDGLRLVLETALDAVVWAANGRPYHP